ncbi:MAG: M50 family metallopeptidase [Bacteroidota bacterium]
MRYSLRLGRVFNIPLYWHWSFLPVMAYLMYTAMRGPGPVDWRQFGLVTALIVLLFGFVLVHELGHALTARRFGLQTEAIIFFPLGGGALIRGKPKSSWREIGVYLAGPMSNLLLALLCLGLLVVLPEGRFFLRYYFRGGGNFSLPFEPFAHLVALSLLINLILFGLNLLPAYPLDGGRILQALLRPRFGQVWATRVVASFGLILCTILWWLGHTRQDWFMLAGALFIGLLAFSALVAAQREAKIVGRTVEELMRPMPNDRLYLQMNQATARQLPGWEEEAVKPVFNEWNELQGFLSFDVLSEEIAKPYTAELPLDKPKTDQIQLAASVDHRVIEKVYDPNWAPLVKEQALNEALQEIMEANAYGGVVYDRGRVKGYLLVHDIKKLLS